MANSQKSVELVIRARDESKRALDSARTALDRFSAAQSKTAARRDFLVSQKQAISDQVDAYREAAAATDVLGRKMAAAKRPSKALSQSFDEAREAARRAKQEILGLGTAYVQATGKTGGRGSFAQFDAGITGRAAADQAAAGVNSLARAMDLAAANAARLNRIANYEGLQKAGANAQQAAAGVNALGSAIAQAGTKQAADATDALADALARVSSATGGTTPKQAAAAQAAASAQRELAAALNAKEQAAMDAARAERGLAAAQLSTDSSAEQLVAAQQRLVAANRMVETTTQRVTSAQHGLATAQRATAQSMGLAGRQAAAWATRQGGGPLGLRPYELQNLSYQINDVFTQIASGTPVMQVAAQQGGQFVQIFPKLGGALLRALPLIGLVAVALSPFITALNKVNEEAKSLSEFDRLLTRSGEGASYTAAQLASVAARLDDYSGSLADARAALAEFVGDSVAPEYLERFGKTALDFARVMKVDVKEAAEQVSNAFTGNADAILNLDDQLNFLTDSERAHVVALRQSKKDAEARTYAFDIFAQRYGETAEKMRGPWTQILSNFSSAWEAFSDTVNLIDFAEAKAKIGGLMQDIARLTAMLPGARTANTANASAFVDRALAARNAAVLNQGEVNRDASSDSGEGRARRRAAQGLVDRRERELRYAETSLALNQLRDGTSSLLTPTPGTAVPRASDTTLDPPKPANSGAGSARRDRSGERRAEQQREFVAGLAAENAERRFALTMIDQEERRRRILEAVREKELAAVRVGLTLSAAQRADIEATVGALYDAEKAHEAVRLIEQARLDLAEARNQVESRDDFVNRKLRDAGLYMSELDAATGEVIASLTREGAEYAGILRTLYDINEATRQRVAAEKEVNDLTALRSDLREQIQFYDDGGEGARADALREQLDGVNAALTAAVDNAINFWTAMGGEGSDAALLRLGLLRDQLAGVGEHAIVSGKQINEMLADGATNAFSQFAQSIGEGANAITSLRDAFLQFASDFLREIAQMILKQAILNALQAASGSGSGGGGGTGATIATAINSLFRHDGGLVGQGGGYKPVALSAFAGATRYHTGGIAGFKPNEVPAVLTRGEEVLTMDDPRHRGNMGGGSPTLDAKIVNVLDGADVLQHALADSRGQRVIMNFFRQNSRAIQSAIS